MQTVSEIKKIIFERSISLRYAWGQNFLVDKNLQEKMLRAARITPKDTVLEIGPGLGALTEELLKRAKKVFVVEKDKGFCAFLKESFAQAENLEIICADILEVEFAKIIKEKALVIGNLPYYITTPIITKLIEKERKLISAIFVTVQKELGERLIAVPGGKDYGAITCLVQFFTQPEMLFSIPAAAFYPQPKVESCFLKMQFYHQPKVKVGSEALFFQLVRAAFNQRRKNILNALAAKWERKTVLQALAKAGIDLRKRAEQLSLEDFARIEKGL
jgi:16S rRNA (adenine1518-N6/adenine1519-N6)-dimethyltransferase